VPKWYRDRLGCVVVVGLSIGVLAMGTLAAITAVLEALRRDPLAFVIGMCIPIAAKFAAHTVRTMVRTVKELW